MGIEWGRFLWSLLGDMDWLERGRMRQGRLVGGRARGGVRVVVFATCLPTYRLQYYCTLPRCGMPGTGTVGRDNHEPTALVEPTMGACGRRQATPAGWAGGPGGVGNGESNSTKTTTRHRGPARPSSWSEGQTTESEHTGPARYFVRHGGA